MAVPLIDITRQYSRIRRQINHTLEQVFDHCQFIMGPEVKKFEQEMAAYCGVRHAVGVASGTDALLIALRAAGIGSGEVISPGLTPKRFTSAGSVSPAWE